MKTRFSCYYDLQQHDKNAKVLINSVISQFLNFEKYNGQHTKIKFIQTHKVYGKGRKAIFQALCEPFGKPGEYENDEVV